MPDFRFLNKRTVAWALYDCGNSAFALSGLAVLFPLFLGSYWSAGDAGPLVTSRLTWANAAASLVVFLAAPVLGTLADAGGYRKRFLFGLAVLGAGSAAALGLVGEGQWQWALLLFISSPVGFYSANVFYDSLIVDVTEPRYFSLVSALGYSLGYFGSALLLALQVAMLVSPDTFGFSGPNDTVDVIFFTIGVWWLVFLIPLMAIVKESRGTSRAGILKTAYSTLSETIRNIRNYRPAVWFLLAYTLYVAGVFTVIVMAVNFGQRLGFEQQDLVMALLITNFVGFPATLVYGSLGHRYGPKRAIYLGLAVYIGVGCWAVFLEDVTQFYVMAVIIGSVQGGVQGMSRWLLASLIPEDKSGEFFGFYNMLTKFAHVVGPLVVGLIGFVSDDPRLILVGLLPLFVIGAVVLIRVPDPGAEAKKV